MPAQCDGGVPRAEAKGHWTEPTRSRCFPWAIASLNTGGAFRATLLCLPIHKHASSIPGGRKPAITGNRPHGSDLIYFILYPFSSCPFLYVVICLVDIT